MSVTFELLKLRRSRRPLLAFLAILLYLLLMLLGFYTYAQSETGGSAEFRYTFENESYFNGLTFAVYAFYFGFLLVLPVFAATEGGAQIAGETSNRTLELLLTRPVSRQRWFFTKFLVATLHCVLLVILLLALALLLGLFTVGWGDLDLYPGVLQMTSSHQHLSQNVALQRMALLVPAAALSLSVPLALSFLMSTYLRSAVNAVGMSVALYLALYVMSEIPFFRDLRPWLFTSDSAYWRALFQESIDWGQFGRTAARLGCFACVFLALAARRFRAREEF